MTLPKTLATLASATAALSMLPALAASAPAQEKTAEVSVTGYDLSKRSDANIVFQRIERAAKRVCAISGIRESAKDRVDRSSCASEAIANAVAALNAPELTALMEAKTEQ